MCDIVRTTLLARACLGSSLHSFQQHFSPVHAAASQTCTHICWCTAHCGIVLTCMPYMQHVRAGAQRGVACFGAAHMHA